MSRNRNNAQDSKIEGEVLKCKTRFESLMSCISFVHSKNKKTKKKLKKKYTEKAPLKKLSFTSIGFKS